MDIHYILLDICDTTINMQTADRFVEFVLSKTSIRRKIKLYFLKSVKKKPFGYIILKKFGVRYKLKILEYLKSLSYDALDSLAKDYYEYELKPKYNKDVIYFLEKFRHKARVIIVSGGYDIYIKYIAADLGVDCFICSELKFHKGIFTGKLKDMDCMGINKVLLLEKRNILGQLEFEKTAVLSDSISDLPLFSLGKYKIAVNPDRELKRLIGKGWYTIKEVM